MKRPSDWSLATRVARRVWTDPSVQDALEFSSMAHHGRVDRIGVPYHRHVIAVAEMVAGLGPDAVIAGLLHDVVEDTPVTLEDLRGRYSEHVVAAVDAVTRRPGETYAEFIRRAVQHPLGRVIKIADNTHNRSRLHKLPDAQAETLRVRYVRAFDTLIMDGEWFCGENDVIGGWCVSPVDLPPSAGLPTIGDFMTEDIARHVTYMHNQNLAFRRSLSS